MIARLLGFAVLGWAFGFVLFVLTLPGPAADQTTDGMVVLTGGPGRVPRGFALIERKKAKRLLISGVDRRVRKHELAVGYGAPLRLVNCCADLGSDSVDTRSNADETAAWVVRHKYRSIRLVTNDWHMPRAHFELARVLASDVRIVPDAVRNQVGLFALLTEYSKYLLRRASALLGI